MTAAIGTALIAAGAALGMEASGTGATAVVIALAVAVAVLVVLLAVVWLDARPQRKPVPTEPSRVMTDDDVIAMVREKRRAVPRRRHDDDTFLADGMSTELNRMLGEDGRD